MTGIAKLEAVVLDCPDPTALARFYGEIAGWEIVTSDAGWISIGDGTSKISFQRVADYHSPIWPDQEHPQQFHIDFRVEDPDAAEEAVLALGAVKHDYQPGEQNGDFRVYLDPAGHPFCLVTD
ncbi:VOC family protein [Streptosporangium sp. KLBMP 9127]|nr:VOC family protein [Streptosporangium sp. KLBMP 9127]